MLFSDKSLYASLHPSTPACLLSLDLSDPRIWKRLPHRQSQTAGVRGGKEEEMMARLRRVSAKFPPLFLSLSFLSCFYRSSLLLDFFFCFFVFRISRLFFDSSRSALFFSSLFCLHLTCSNRLFFFHFVSSLLLFSQ